MEQRPDRSEGVKAVAAVFMSVATVAVFLRVYCRLKLVKNFGWDDGLMVMAMLCYIMFSACMIGGSLYGTGRYFEDLTPENRQTAMKYWWLCEIGYCFSAVFCKASVCLFLLRITVRPLHNWILHVMMFLTVSTGLLFMFLMLLQCKPLSFFWTRVGPNPPANGTCINMSAIIAMTYLYSAVAALCDFTCGLLPVWLVWNLNMKKDAKIALAGILSMACIASAAVIIRFPYVKTFADPEFLYATVDIALLSNIENGLGITAASLATLRPLIRHIRGQSMSDGYLDRPSGSSSRPRQTQGCRSFQLLERCKKPLPSIQRHPVRHGGSGSEENLTPGVTRHVHIFADGKVV